MANLLPIAGLLLVLHASQSYILLTANIDDIQNVAQHILKSPVPGAVQQAMRRAYGIFTDQLGKIQPDEKRDDYARADSEISLEDSRNEDLDGDHPEKGKKSNLSADLLSLGQHASVYLRKFKDMFESVVVENPRKNSVDNNNKE